MAPAIIFGVMSKPVTLKGVLASVVLGAVLLTLYVADQLIGSEAGAPLFSLAAYKADAQLHIVTMTLVAVSCMTERIPADGSRD